MLKLKPNQLEKVFTVGTKLHQLNIVPEKLYSIKPLYTHITKIEENNIIPFLDYQYQSSEYKKVFLMLFEKRMGSLGKIFTINQKNICRNWFLETCPFTGLFLRNLKDIFCDFDLDSKRELQEWEKEIISSTDRQDSTELKEYLNYGQGILEEGYKLHLIRCTNPVSCMTNESFEFRIKVCKDLIKGIIEIEEEQTQKNNTPTNYNKTEWLGTQKQLAELFIELKEKGWIEKFEPDAINLCFTSAKTIKQVLKPTYDHKEPFYEQVYTTMYSPSFRQIKINIKSKK